MEKSKLEEYYEELALKWKDEYKNRYRVPKITKIILSGSSNIKDNKSLKELYDDTLAIACQLPKTTNSKKSVAAFGTRAGQPIGVMVTLRRRSIYWFLSKLIIALSRDRDFKGFKSINYLNNKISMDLGIKERHIFPEVNTRMNNLGINIHIDSNCRKEEDFKKLITGITGIPMKGEIKHGNKR